MPLHQALFRGAIFLMRVLLSWAADNDDDNDDDGDDDDDDEAAADNDDDDNDDENDNDNGSSGGHSGSGGIVRPDVGRRTSSRGDESYGNLSKGRELR